jgi:hypothetical protein
MKIFYTREHRISFVGIGASNLVKAEILLQYNNKSIKEINILKINLNKIL